MERQDLEGVALISFNSLGGICCSSMLVIVGFVVEMVLS